MTINQTWNQIFSSYSKFKTDVIDVILTDYNKPEWADDEKMYTIWLTLFIQFSRRFGNQPVRYSIPQVFIDKLIYYLENHLIELYVVQQPYSSSFGTDFKELENLGWQKKNKTESTNNQESNNTSTSLSNSGTSQQPFNSYSIKIENTDKIKEKIGTDENSSDTLKSNTTYSASQDGKSFHYLQNLKQLNNLQLSLRIIPWLDNFIPLFRYWY